MKQIFWIQIELAIPNKTTWNGKEGGAKVAVVSNVSVVECTYVVWESVVSHFLTTKRKFKGYVPILASIDLLALAAPPPPPSSKIELTSIELSPYDGIRRHLW